jgi:hypothetical protein
VEIGVAGDTHAAEYEAVSVDRPRADTGANVRAYAVDETTEASSDAAGTIVAKDAIDLGRAEGAENNDPTLRVTLGVAAAGKAAGVSTEYPGVLRNWPFAESNA